MIASLLLCTGLRAPTARMDVVVQLSRVLPMMPVVSSDARAERVIRFDGAVSPSRLAWVPQADYFTGSEKRQRSVDRLGFVVGGNQWTWIEGAGLLEQLLPAAGLDAHCVSAPATITAVGGGHVWARDVDSGGVSAQVSLGGVGAYEIVALGERLLIASTDGRLLLLELDEGREGLGGLGGRPPEWVILQGVSVFDEMAEPLLTLSMPAPPSGLCFGRFHGSTLSTLFVGAADSIWAVPTNVQGAEASRSFRFLKQIEKQVQAQRHDNW